MNTRELLDNARAWKQASDYAEEIAKRAEKMELQKRWEDVVSDIQMRLNVPAEIVPHANCDTLLDKPMMIRVNLEGFSIFASVYYSYGNVTINSWLSAGFDEDGNLTSMIPQENIYLAVLASAEAAGIQ